MQVFNRQVSAWGLAVFGFEAMLIPLTIVIAAQVTGTLGAGGGWLWKVVLATALYELCFYYNDLYDLTRVRSRAELVAQILQGAGAAAIVLAAASLVVPSLTIGHTVFLTSLSLTMIAVPIWRMTVESLTRDPHIEERVLILGTGVTALTLARQINTQRDFPYRLIGFISDGDGPCHVRQHDVLGTAADMAPIVAARRIDRIVVALSDRRGRLPIDALMHAKLSGVRVEWQMMDNRLGEAQKLGEHDYRIWIDRRENTSLSDVRDTLQHEACPRVCLFYRSFSTTCQT